MASNVSINGGNSCTVQSAAGVIAPTNDRKKVIITATGGDGTVKFGTAATAITVKQDTFLEAPEDENFSTKKTFEEYEKLWEYFHTSPSVDEWNKYQSFEKYAKLIANENCVLSIFEYTKFRTNLNNICIII